MCKNAFTDSYYEGMLNAGQDYNNELAIQHRSCINMELFGENSNVLLVILKEILYVKKDAHREQYPQAIV